MQVEERMVASVRERSAEGMAALAAATDPAVKASGGAGRCQWVTEHAAMVIRRCKSCES
jgi:hypothetical protein